MTASARDLQRAPVSVHLLALSLCLWVGHMRLRKQLITYNGP